MAARQVAESVECGRVQPELWHRVGRGGLRIFVGSCVRGNAGDSEACTDLVRRPSRPTKSGPSRQTAETEKLHTSRRPLRAMLLHRHMRIQVVQRPVRFCAVRKAATTAVSPALQRRQSPPSRTRGQTEHAPASVQPLNLIIPSARPLLDSVSGQRHERVRLAVLPTLAAVFRVSVITSRARRAGASSGARPYRVEVVQARRPIVEIVCAGRRQTRRVQWEPARRRERRRRRGHCQPMGDAVHGRRRKWPLL